MTEVKYNIGNGYEMSVEYDENGIAKITKECFETLIEKQIPKMAIRSKEPRYGMGEEYYDWICPTCGKWLAYSPDRRRYEIHHCICGQKLDWSDEDDRAD